MAHTHTVIDTDPHFIVDVDTRHISCTTDDKVILIQGDHNSERFTFDIPRYVDGHDMTLCDKVEVHYINIEGSNASNRNSGIYKVTDLAATVGKTDTLTCTWLVSRGATQLIGGLNFVLRFACTDNGRITYCWNTAVCSDVSIATSIDNASDTDYGYTDILETWYNELMMSGTMGVNLVNEATNEGIAKLGMYGGVIASPTQPEYGSCKIWINTGEVETTEVYDENGNAIDTFTLNLFNVDDGAGGFIAIPTFQGPKGEPGGIANITHELGDNEELVISQKASANLFGRRAYSRTQNPAHNHLVRMVSDGGRPLAPDNSIPALRLAKRDGFNFVKCVVQMTSDNVPVVFRDEYLIRAYDVVNNAPVAQTIEGYTSISQYTSTWLANNIDLRSLAPSNRQNNYIGALIPTLAGYLGVCKKIGVYPYIEFSDYVSWSPAKVLRVVSTVRDAGMLDCVTYLFNDVNDIKYLACDVNDSEYHRCAYNPDVRGIKTVPRVGLIVGDSLDDYVEQTISDFAEDTKKGIFDGFIVIRTSFANHDDIGYDGDLASHCYENYLQYELISDNSYEYDCEYLLADDRASGVIGKSDLADIEAECDSNGNIT